MDRRLSRYHRGSYPQIGFAKCENHPWLGLPELIAPRFRPTKLSEEGSKKPRLSAEASYHYSPSSSRESSQTLHGGLLASKKEASARAEAQENPVSS